MDVLLVFAMENLVIFESANYLHAEMHNRYPAAICDEIDYAIGKATEFCHY